MSVSNSSSSSLITFDEARAEAYDTQFQMGRPFMDNLHLVTRIVLAGLPADARILCAGAGTGAEALYLASVFPGWQFTLLDPSEAMLNVARRRTDAAGVSDRCTFHVGYMESLNAPAPFDAATSFLVSHFITDTDERQRYFNEISARLKPGALFVNADIAADMTAETFPALMEAWLGFYALLGMPEEGRKAFPEMFGRDVAAHPPQKVEELIKAARFDQPVPFFQSLLIRGWFTRKQS